MKTPEGLKDISPELLARFPQERDPIFFQDLYLIASEIRKGAFNTILNAGSGHLGASSSSVEMLTSLYFGGVLKYDRDDPNHPDRDRVLLRGHLGPARYKIFSLLGWIDESLLERYRRLGGLPGHEEMGEVPGVDITPTGSLGMELSYGAGVAFAAKRMGKEFKTFVFLGDGEEQEGSVSEAARHIAIMGLDNIVAIIDKNGKQLSRPTSGVEDIAMIWAGYGWDVREISDGNDIVEVQNTLKKAREDRNGKPILVISNTIKGLGVPGATENFCGYHTVSSCDREDLKTGIANQERIMTGCGYSSEQIKALATKYADKNRLSPSEENHIGKIEINIQPDPEYSSNLQRGLEYYRRQLADFFKTEPEITFYSMTADLMKMNLVQLYGFDQDPVVHIDTGIREQHLISMAYGLSLTDKSARILINLAELTAYRASDQMGVMAIGGGKMVILSEGGGLNGSRDGATHQVPGIPGMILTMPQMVMYEPADVIDAYNCLNKSLSDYENPVYLRTHWRETPPLPRAEKDLTNTSYYEVGTCNGKPDVVLVASGLTTQGALEAKMILERQYQIVAKVINVVDLKSLDENFVYLLETGAPVLTIYNGLDTILKYPVSSAIMQHPVKIPSIVEGHGFIKGATGLLDELLVEFKFDGKGIIDILKNKFPDLFKVKI